MCSPAIDLLINFCWTYILLPNGSYVPPSWISLNLNHWKFWWATSRSAFRCKMKFARRFSQSFLGQKVSKKTSVHPDQVWLYAKSAGSAQMMMLPLSLQYWRIRLYDVQVRWPSHRSTYFSPFLSSPIHSSLHSEIFGYASAKLWNASFSHHSRICNLHGDVWIWLTKVSCRNLLASSVEANSK